MPHTLRVELALLAITTLGACSSSGGSDATARDAEGQHDGAAVDADTGASDARLPSDAGFPSDAGSAALDATPDGATPETGPSDVGPADTGVRLDAGCVAPLANCNGSGLTCEVNTSTNAQNCGACGHSCLGATCTSSLCNVTMLGEADNLESAMGPDGIFYTTNATSLPSVNHTINRVNGLTGTVETIDMGNGGPGGIETDANYVYYAIQGSPNAQIYRKAHTASATVSPELLFSTSSFPTFMVLRSGTFYWISCTGSAPFYIYKRSLTAPPSDPGTQVTLVSEPARAFTFVATSTTLYWRNYDTGHPLRQLAITGSVATTVTGPDSIGPLHADEKKVYWGVRGPASDQGVYAYYAGGTVTRLCDGDANQAIPDPFSDQIYFGDGYDNTAFYRVSKSGGAPVKIALSFFGADFLGIDARFVWSAGGWGGFSPMYRYVK